jgi:dihydroorotase
VTSRLFAKNIWNEARARFEAGLIEISGKNISAISFGEPEGTKAKQKIHDLDDLFVGPSAIDLHVHARDFDESHKETLESCEAAAFKGGVATAVCMANTRPRLDTVEQVDFFLKKAKARRVQFIPFASVSKNLEGCQPTDWNMLLKRPVAGLSDDGRPILDEKLFRAALGATKKTKKLLSLHEEDTTLSKGSQLHFSETSLRLGVEGSSEEAESSMVARDLRIAAELGAHIHLGHISSAKSVQLIRRAKKSGVSVSAELTPHHGHCEVSEAEAMPIEKLAFFKVCPPIRDREDRAMLLKGVHDGTLDCFASDHAPHSAFEKNLPIDQAMHGLIGLEYFFTLYNELRIQNHWSWKTFYSAWVSRPATLLNGLTARRTFRAGSEASFVIFDPALPQELHWSKSKSSNTIFEARKMRGVIFQHWIQGEKVYDIVKNK